MGWGLVDIRRSIINMLSCLKKMRVHGESLIPVTPVYSFYICTAALPSLMCSLDGAAMSSNINSIKEIFKCVQLSRDSSSRFLDIQSCIWIRVQLLPRFKIFEKNQEMFHVSDVFTTTGFTNPSLCWLNIVLATRYSAQVYLNNSDFNATATVLEVLYSPALQMQWQYHRQHLTM